MDLYNLLRNKGFTGYSLAKNSGVSYTTIKDLLNGKRKIENLPGKTILSLAKTLDCTMEEVMRLDGKRWYPSSNSYLRKSDYYKDLLANKKNVMLRKDSALEFYHLSNDSISDNVFVYSCGELDEPYINKRVENFDDIDYQIIDGVMVTSLEQTINDIVNDDDTDLQPLYEALNKYYYKNNESFSGLKVENKNKFDKIAENSLKYYNEEETDE